MKKIVLVLVFMISCSWAHAQLQATLNVDSNPTPELSEWTNRNNLAILTVTNPNPGVLIDYQIKVTLLLDNDVKLVTDNTVPYMVADFGTETFLADELIPYNAVQFVDTGFRDQISRTGMLPPGSYSFCIELIDREGRSLTQPEQICRPMIITDYQMPELLSPVGGKVIDPLLINSLMFQWTPLVPVPDMQTGISYLIAVSEVQPGQTPSQAFSVNYPIIEEEVTVGTQFIWPLDLPAPDEDQQYVWGIKPMTREGNTYRAQNNGFVDYGVFMIRGNNKSGDGGNRGNDKSGGVDCSMPNDLFTNHLSPSIVNDKLVINGLDIALDTYCGYLGLTSNCYETVTTDWSNIISHTSGISSWTETLSFYDIQNEEKPKCPKNICFTIEVEVLVDGVPTMCSHTFCLDLDKNLRNDMEDIADTFYQDGLDKKEKKEEDQEAFYQSHKNALDCENGDEQALLDIFIYQAMYPDHPETVVILALDALRLTYLSQVTNGTYDFNEYAVTTVFDWGDVSNYDTQPGNIADHNYVGMALAGGFTIPKEVCITIEVTDKTFQELTCSITICKDIPQEQLDLIKDLLEEAQENLENGSNDNDEECACLDNSSVSIPDLTMEYEVNGAGDEHTLTIPGSPAALQSIIDCMASQEQFDGDENMDGHPEYNYQSGFFTGTVTHQWHIPDAMNDPSNTHMFTELDDDEEPLPEFVTVTFHIVNPNADIDCYFTQDVPVPHDAYNAINGTEECECDDDTALDEPELTLLRPDAVEEPREILFGGIIAYRDYLLNCNSNYSLATHSMDVTINWDEEHDEESIVNSGPFTHTYDADEHQIPEELCVTFSITPLFPSSDGQACVTTICLPVPEEWLELNTPAVGDGDLAAGDTLFAGEHVDGQGEFEIIVDTITGDGPFSGTGVTHIPWLLANVAVEFTDITVDADANLVSGEITVVVADTAPAYPYGCVGMGHDNAEDIQAWLTTDGEIVDYTPALPFLAPLEAPFGINFPSGDIIAVSSMVFKPTKSEFNLLVIKQFQPDVNPDQVLGFKACDTDFHPAAPVWPPERLELLEDITLGNVNNKITFTFKAPVPGTSPGCYIEWGSTGITNYAVELDVDFTREWLIPVDEIDGTEKSTANLVGAGVAWDGLVLTGNLEESILSATIPNPDDGTPTDTGAHDFIILADEIAMDMADTLNTPGMTFPPIYTGETTNLFRGFYMDELTVKFSPNKMNTPGGDPIEVSINDMIIDDTGITLTAEVENLIAFGGAEVADMVASIDRVYLEILSSNFVEAGVEGRIAIPVNEGNGLDNSLAYTALFNNPLDPALNNNFQLILEPDQPIQNDLFGGGEFTLDETSNLTGYFDKDKKTFTMDLNGDFAWEDATVGPVDQINMSLGFEGLGFDYDSSLATNKLTFDQGIWAFASPQKKVANFPVTIEEIDFIQMPTTGNQLMHGKLMFDVIFNLSDKIGGRSTLGIEGAIADTKLSGGKTFDPELIGAVVDSISISADMAAVKINGAIGFRDNDPIYGNGFIGTLDAEFKAGGIKVGALAEFGNTTYGHTGPYRYWRVEAAATFPAPGITFLPGMAFRGFGGGAFRNMIATPDGSDFTFTPEYDQLGFRANAVLATTPKEETFNADVGLLAAFSGSGGMTNIAFTGDFYVGAKIVDRTKAKIDGAVGVSYNFPDKHFLLTADVNINAPPITTPSPMNLILDIDGKKNEWFFKFGVPDYPNTVKVSGVTLYEYLMFGNKIPNPGGFTTTFENNYYNAVGNYPYAGTTGTGGVGDNTAQGKGFALGIGFMFDKDGEYEITNFGSGEKKHVLDWDLSAGAELHLSYMQYVGSCGGYTPLGINGYRAKGGLGMYGTASAGVTRYKKNGSTKWHINLASIKAGAWITGEFPKPVYAAGAVEGEVGLFDDLISFDFYQSFEYGTYCTNPVGSAGAPVTQGDAAAEQANALITYVKASPSAEFPLTQPVIAKFGLNPDEVFDVSEQQSNGTVEMRTFKMVKTQSFKIENETTGAWETVAIDQSQNNLGEYLYTKKPPMGSAMAAPAVLSMSPAPSFGSFGVAAPAAAYVSSPAMGISGAASALSGAAVAGPSGLTSYPVTPSDDYDDLPPDPDPVINDLEDNRRYQFTVTAVLKEYNGTGWTTALKNDGTPVTQTITKTFSTGPMTAVSAGAATF
ncbi:MAG: hypothetical protein ACSHWW_08735 [Nonlabens sp.]|uniref:hypothetical protein n=1 Tax=Nonlabens sp. TaxID=1888209 RepID=UPI003EF1B8C0